MSGSTSTQEVRIRNLPKSMKKSMKKKYNNDDHELYDEESIKRWIYIRNSVFILITIFILLTITALILSIISIVKVEKMNCTCSNN